MKKERKNKSYRRARVFALIVIIIAIVAFGGTKITKVQRIQVNLEFLVSQQTEEVFDCLNDFENYPLWWTERFKVKYEGDNAVLFAAGPGIWVGWRRDSYHAPDRIDYTYHIGPHTGTGIWTIQPVPEGTRASLDIDVKPKNLWVELLYKAIGFSKKHAVDIEELVQDMSRYIEAEPKNGAESQH